MSGSSGAPAGVLAVLAAGLLTTGCASTPYTYGKGIERSDTLALAADEPQIERGTPNKFLDGLGHYVLSLPSKLLLLSWRVDNHNVSPETEAKLRQYLAENGLSSVKVRINEYAPGNEWRRLFANKAVAPGWRYTLGVLTVASYTIFPGRAFGGDNYNPYTNTVNLYSDHKAIAVHEAGHAKDFAQRPHRGNYAALRMLPIVPLYQEGKASGDAIGYDIDQCNTRDEKEDYKILYPAYGTYVAGEGMRFSPAGQWTSYAISFGAAAVGHVVGRTKASKVEDAEGAGRPSAAASLQ